MLVEHKPLKTALALLRQVIPTTNDNPVYKQIYLNPTEGQLEIAATNGTLFARVALPILGNRSIAKPFCLPAEAFCSAINNLPLEDNILFKVYKKRVSMSVSDSAVELPPISPTDFPLFPTSFSPYLSIQATPFAAALLTASRFAIDAKLASTKPVLSGPHMVQLGDRVRIYGTDGYCLARIEMPATLLSEEKGRIVVPRESARLLHGMVSTNEEAMLTVELNDSYLHFQQAHFSLFVRRVLGTPPDCERIIPPVLEHAIVLPTQRLREVLKLFTAMDKEAYVIMNPEDDHMLIEMETETRGGSRAKVPYVGDKLPFRLRLNPTYFNKVATALVADDVSISCNGSESPMFISDASDALYMVMPAKLT